MARPQRNNVDYFPFLCEEGEKMFYLEETYGNDGFATFIKLLRELAKVDYHYLNLSKPSSMMFLSAKCKVSTQVLEAIINDLVMLEKFDAILWNENKIIWCQDFIDSIQDAYFKRSNKCIDYKSLLLLLDSLGVRKLSKGSSKPLKSSSKDTVNPQSIVKDIKVKEIKGSEIDISHFGSDFMIHWETWLAYKKSQFGFRYKQLSSEQTAFNDLVKKANGEKLQAIAIINNSIANGWKGLIEMKNYYPQIEPLHPQTTTRPIGTTKSMFE